MFLEDWNHLHPRYFCEIWSFDYTSLAYFVGYDAITKVAVQPSVHLLKARTCGWHDFAKAICFLFDTIFCPTMTGMNLPEYFFKFLYANGKYFIYVLQIRPAYLHVESSHMRTLHKQS